MFSEWEAIVGTESTGLEMLSTRERKQNRTERSGERSYTCIFIILQLSVSKVLYCLPAILVHHLIKACFKIIMMVWPRLQKKNKTVKVLKTCFC